MIYHKFGKSNLDVSILGMGTGGYDPLGQKSKIHETEIHKLLLRAFELGINLFDTAPGYLDSELILGRFLKKVPRKEVIVSTKITLSRKNNQKIEMLNSNQIINIIEKSLKRLKLSEIDIILIQGLENTFNHLRDYQIPVLLKLKEQGKIRHIGASEKSAIDGSHIWLEKIIKIDARMHHLFWLHQ